MLRRSGSQPVPRPRTSRGPLRDPGRCMAEVRRLAKPPIVACDHPECRGQVRPWLAEPRAGRSPIHLAEYRQFPTRRSDFEKKGDSTVSGRLGENAPANRSLWLGWVRPLQLTPISLHAWVIFTSARNGGWPDHREERARSGCGGSARCLSDLCAQDLETKPLGCGPPDASNITESRRSRERRPNTAWDPQRQHVDAYGKKERLSAIRGRNRRPGWSEGAQAARACQKKNRHG